MINFVTQDLTSCREKGGLGLIEDGTAEATECGGDVQAARIFGHRKTGRGKLKGNGLIVLKMWIQLSKITEIIALCNEFAGEYNATKI